MSWRNAFNTSADSSSGLRSIPAAGNAIPLPVPISRLNSAAVFAGSCSMNRRARVPTVIRSCLSMRTTDGVTEAPWALRTTDTCSPSNTACVAEFRLVPRSIPT